MATAADAPNHSPGARPALSRGLLAAALLIVALATLGPRLWGLSGAIFFEDECFHAELAARPWGQILDHCQVSPTYPGWYAPYKIWMLVAPDTDLGRKAHSVFWGCLAVLAMFFLGREAAGTRGGIVAALLLAFNGYHINYSQTATPYAFIMFLGVAAAWSLLVLLRRGGWRAALCHAVVVAAAFYTHPTAVFLTGAEVAAALLLALAGRRRHLGAFALSQGLALILSAGALILMGHHWQVMQQSGGAAYIPEVSLDVVLERLLNLTAYRSEARWGYPLQGLTLLAGGAAGLCAVAATWRGGAGRWPAAALLCLWALPFAASMTAGALINREIFYEARFFALFLPAGCALLAVAATWPRPERLGRYRAVLLAVVLASALLPQVGSLRYLLGGGADADKFPVRAVLAHLEKHAGEGDLAVVHHSWYLSFFRRYHRGPHPKVVGAVHQQIQHSPYGGVRDATTADDVRRVLARLKGYRRLFLVLSPGALEEWRDPKGLVEAAVDRRFALVDQRCFNCERFAARIKLYDLTRAPAPAARKSP